MYSCSVLLFANSQTSQRALSHVLPCRVTTWAIFQLLQQRFVIPTFFGVHPKCTWSRNDVGSRRSTSFIKFFHTGARFCFLPSIFIHVILVFDEETNIPTMVLFPIQAPAELLRTVFPTRGLQVDVRTNFVRQPTTGSSVLDRHSDFGCFTNFGAPPIFTWV